MFSTDKGRLRALGALDSPKTNRHHSGAQRAADHAVERHHGHPAAKGRRPSRQHMAPLDSEDRVAWAVAGARTPRVVRSMNVETPALGAFRIPKASDEIVRAGLHAVSAAEGAAHQLRRNAVRRRTHILACAVPDGHPNWLYATLPALVWRRSSSPTSRTTANSAPPGSRAAGLARRAGRA